MKASIPPFTQAIVQRGTSWLMDRDWYRYLRELWRILGSHTHDGDETAELSHKALTDIGANTHSEIDDALDSLEDSVRKIKGAFPTNTRRERFLAKLGKRSLSKTKRTKRILR